MEYNNPQVGPIVTVREPLSNVGGDVTEENGMVALNLKNQRKKEMFMFDDLISVKQAQKLNLKNIFTRKCHKIKDNIKKIVKKRLIPEDYIEMSRTPEG
jgi:hypothetical protein